MKTVALVGFSKTSNGAAYNLPPDVEMWTLNHAYRFNFPRIDRLFDMHVLELMSQPNYYVEGVQREHWEFLTSEHSFPIYMQTAYPEVPAAVRYPIEDAVGLDGPGFTSSFPYMMAMAVLEDFERIEVYGFDMDHGTEYEFQRQDALDWIWYARGLGIEVYIPPESGLNEKRKLYGYEAIQMVNRHTLENHKEGYENQMQKAIAIYNQAVGVLQERHNSHSSRRRIAEANQAVNAAKEQIAIVDGALQAINHLIDTCDLKEVEPILTLDELIAEKVPA